MENRKRYNISTLKYYDIRSGTATKSREVLNNNSKVKKTISTKYASSIRKLAET